MVCCRSRRFSMTKTCSNNGASSLLLQQVLSCPCSPGALPSTDTATCSRPRDVALNSIEGLSIADWDVVPAVLPAGGVSVHDWRTLHGSGPNHSGAMRMSLAVHMRTGRSWPRSTKPGEMYLDQFLHDRHRHCCPVVLGDPNEIRGDSHLPLVFEEPARL
jgi:hypothetical protein